MLNLAWAKLSFDIDFKTLTTYFILENYEIKDSYDGNTDSIAYSGSRISGEKEGIRLTELEGKSVTVYGIDGHTVKELVAGFDTCFIALDRGLYIVKAGDKTVKTMVR